MFKKRLQNLWKRFKIWIIFGVLGISTVLAAPLIVPSPEILPSTLTVDNQFVQFVYTDDNENEDLIIYTDQEFYNNPGLAPIQFAIANQSGKDQNINILFFTANSKQELVSIYELNKNVGFPKEVRSYETIDYDCSFVDTTNTMQLIPKTCQRENEIIDIETEYRDIWEEKQLIEFDDTAYIPLSNDQKVKDKIKDKRGFKTESTYLYLLPKDQVAYFKANIKYPYYVDDEFFIEVIGDKGGYGHLDPFLSGWDQRIKLTTDSSKVDSNLSHFPITAFLETANGDTEKIFTEVTTNSLKIAMTQSDKTTQMYVDIEKWDNPNQEGIIHFGLNGDTLSSSTSTVYYIYYDNDQADNTGFVGTGASTPAYLVWDSNYQAIWHLADDDSDQTVIESTDNINTGTKQANAEPASATAKIGFGQRFDGFNDNITRTDTASLSITGDLALSAWVNLDAHRDGQHLKIHAKDDSGNESWVLVVRKQDGSFSKQMEGLVWNSSYSQYIVNLDFVATADEHIVMTYDNSTGTIVHYLNGVVAASTLIAQNTGAIDDANSVLYIGGNGSRLWDGLIDEMRISDSKRSAAWWKAEFNSGNDSLLTYGTEEATETATVRSWSIILE